MHDHPRHRHVQWRIVALFVLSILLGLIVGWIIGREEPQFFRGATFFQQAYVVNNPHPEGLTAGLPIPRSTAPTQTQYVLPSSWFPTIYDQGQIGQCECYAFKLQFEALYFKRTGTHIQISCKFAYSVVGQGQDPGSTIYQYIQQFLNIGWVSDQSYPYSLPATPDQLQWPIDSKYYALAVPHRYALGYSEIAPDANAGQGAIDKMEYYLAVKHRPVNFGQPVFAGPGSNGTFDVNQNSGHQDIPDDVNKVSIAGYHATTIKGYFRNLCFNGTCGWALAQNSWNTWWGLNCKTLQMQMNNGGCYLISYRFIEKYGFLMGALSLQKSVNPSTFPTSKPPPPFTQPGAAQDRPLSPPKVTNLRTIPAASSGQTWVYGVCAKDTTGPDPKHVCHGAFDLAPSLNQQAHYEGISPVGMLAVIGAECGLYTHSTQCDRLGGGYDYSFGDCQVTIATASQFGLGNGYYDGYLGYNATRVRNYENYPPQCHYIAGRVLGNFAAYERNACPSASDFPHLYVAWNAGPGQPCWFLMTPTGQAGSNYYNNFLGWYNWAWGYGRTGPDPYAQKPQTLQQRCGNLVKGPHLYGSGRGRYYKGIRQRCVVFTWPGYGWRQKIVPRK